MYRNVAAGLVALMTIACGDSPPTGPAGNAVPEAASGVDSVDGVATAQNEAPLLRFKSTPAADFSTDPPTIKGRAPLTVTFNLCQSSDPDQVILPDGSQDPSGDTLNWQFHFGDSGTPAFNADGTFNADFDHHCRVEHTYDEGTFTATLTVTDKHLEDQSRGVSALALATGTTEAPSDTTGGYAAGLSVAGERFENQSGEVVSMARDVLRLTVKVSPEPELSPSCSGVLNNYFPNIPVPILGSASVTVKQGEVLVISNKVLSGSGLHRLEMPPGNVVSGPVGLKKPVSVRFPADGTYTFLHVLTGGPAMTNITWTCAHS